MSGLFAKKTRISNTETKVGALSLQNSSQGVPIPLVYGTTKLAPNLIHYFDFTAIAHTETQRSGGKGGGGVEQTNTTYTYTVGVIYALCQGPSANGSACVGTIWKGKDVTSTANLGLTTYGGNYTQTAWPYMATAHPGDEEAHRGIAYAATAALDLGASSSLPNFNFEVTGLIGAGDVSPADVLEDVLTSPVHGASWPAAQLDSLADLAAYCAAANIAIAPAYTAQRPASEIVADLLRVANSAPVWSDGLLKVRTYADAPVGAYTPNLTPVANLTHDDFLADAGEPPVKVRRTRAADAFNIVTVNCRDRANGYNTATVSARDLVAIELFGPRPMDPIDLPECQPSVGRFVAQAVLQRQLYVRSTYEFRVGWKHARLEPMDIVALYDPTQALAGDLARIIEVEEDEEGRLTIKAEEVGTGAATVGTYATQGSSSSQPAGAADPGDAYAPVIIQPPLVLTGGRPQVWIGAQGGTSWGGAQVWVSVDGGSSYSRVGSITAPARYGTLAANMPAAADPDTTSSVQVDLTTSRGALNPAVQAAADAGSTLCWVDGEVIAYTAATLTGAYQYTLDTYLRRGQAGTAAAAHASGATFLRLDEAVARADISTSMYGQTLHIKLVSFNSQGGGLQDAAGVPVYTYTVQAQVATGDGYAWQADRSTTAVADPGAGKMRWNNAAAANASVLVFDELTADGANMAQFFTSLGGQGLVELRDAADSAKWATYRITGAAAPGGYVTCNVAHQAGAGEIPTGDTVLARFTPTTPAATAMTINAQTANYTLATADFAASTMVQVTSANATVITVPSDANVSTADGANVLIARGGNGTVSVAAQANVTINVAGNLVLRTQHSVASLVKTAPNTWRLFGDLT